MVSTTRRRVGRRHEDRFYTSSTAARTKRLMTAALIGGLGVMAAGLTWAAMITDHVAM